MHIAIVTTAHPALDARIFYREAVSLAEAGHVVTLIAPWGTGVEEEAKSHGVGYVPLRVSGHWAVRPLRWLRLLRLLHSRTYDAWHLHDLGSLLLAVCGRALQRRHVPIVYDLREDTGEDMPETGQLPHWLRRPAAWMAGAAERWGMRRCALVLAATDTITQRARLSAWRCLPVRDYPLAAPEWAMRQPRRRRRLVRVIYAGALSEERGIRELVGAMGLIGDRPIELVLLGRFCREAFAAEIGKMAGPNVKIFPEVPYDQVARYLWASDIGIVFLRPTAALRQAQPTELYEYMQAGLPVIASDIPLWRRIVHGAGCGAVVDCRKPAAIAHAIRRIADDRPMRRRMGRLGQRVARERYVWEKEAKVLVAAYAGLASDEAARLRRGIRPSAGLEDLEQTLADRRAGSRAVLRRA